MNGDESNLEVGDIDESFVPRFRDEVAAVELDGEAVLLDGSNGAVHTLNPTATLIWKFCDGATRLGDLIEDLVAVFDDTNGHAIHADVMALVRDFARQGLLVGVRAGPAEGDEGTAHGHTHGEHPGELHRHD